MVDVVRIRIIVIVVGFRWFWDGWLWECLDRESMRLFWEMSGLDVVFLKEIVLMF